MASQFLVGVSKFKKSDIIINVEIQFESNATEHENADRDNLWHIVTLYSYYLWPLIAAWRRLHLIECKYQFEYTFKLTCVLWIVTHLICSSSKLFIFHQTSKSIWKGQLDLNGQPTNSKWQIIWEKLFSVLNKNLR